ncbi:MAG: class I SAM-dependent methyltransferase [Polyangiaceae bacterium]|nr:class I SAM-dependent methyltransferase [Polyangiaceae bacterium]
MASRLLPWGAAAIVRASRGALRPLVRDASRVLSAGLVDHVTLRTLAIDRAVERAVASGAAQCVILGAGLDTRAHRLAVLGSVPTFEVDHPAMQAEKRKRMATAEIANDRVIYAPIDFHHDSLEDVLAAAGHDAARATLWIWEGVTMYLTRAATEATLGTIARASAPGSELALTYVVPRGIPRGSAGVFVRAFFGALGEPLDGTFALSEMGALLDSFGFEPREDTSSSEWARTEGSSPLLPLAFRGERLVVATKRG